MRMLNRAIKAVRSRIKLLALESSAWSVYAPAAFQAQSD
jgi:hypothetical protein